MAGTHAEVLLHGACDRSNVLAVQATSGRQHPSPEVCAAVDKELLRLSKSRPVLPWVPTESSSGGAAAADERQEAAAATVSVSKEALVMTRQYVHCAQCALMQYNR